MEFQASPVEKPVDCVNNLRYIQVNASRIDEKTRTFSEKPSKVTGNAGSNLA